MKCAPYLVTLCLLAVAPAAAADKPRLVVLTDIGGDPDDRQSMIRLMHYANEFEIEGLVATAAGTPGELKRDIVRPELIREVVEAYGKVRPNLLLHRPDYPEAKHLLDRVKTGNPKRGVKSLGADHDTEGSRWITALVDRDDPRPVNVTIWGGSTDLAQALWRVRNDRTPEQLKRFLGKLRVYDISHQDDTGPWINANFPDLFYVLSKAAPGQDKRTGGYRGMYLGGDESLTSRAWVDANLLKGRGPLGALYPTATWTAPNPHATLKEGDTPSWFYFLPTGLNDPAHPEWGGWGGRFRHEKGGLHRDAKDTVGDVTDSRATVWRWRPAFQADFAARTRWCVQPAKGANHPPAPVLNGDRTLAAVQLMARPGELVKLSAAGSSDPDGDRLAHRWSVYPEAGTYGKAVAVEGATTERASLTVPADAQGTTIHVILEVTDGGTPALTRYRRAVLSVAPGRDRDEKRPTYPAADWEKRAPEQVGLSAGKLAALAELAGGSGCVVRHGYLAHAWGDPAKSADIASAVKPIISTLLLLAVQDGKLASVDAKVADFEPGLLKLNNGKDAGITWRHLASQTSGYGLAEPPGTAYAYNDSALALYYDTLTRRVYKRDGTSVLKERLGDVLGFQDEYTFEAFGPKDRPGRLAISVRDLARFGLLYLRDGRWNDRQVLKPELVRLALGSPVPGDLPRTAGKQAEMLPEQRTLGGGKDQTPLGPGVYSFNWWVNRDGKDGKRLFADLPADAYVASGHGGKRALWVVPSLDLIVAWNDAKIDDHNAALANPMAKCNQAARLIREAAGR